MKEKQSSFVRKVNTSVFRGTYRISLLMNYQRDIDRVFPWEIFTIQEKEINYCFFSDQMSSLDLFFFFDPWKRSPVRESEKNRVLLSLFNDVSNGVGCRAFSTSMNGGKSSGKKRDSFFFFFSSSLSFVLLRDRHRTSLFFPSSKPSCCFFLCSIFCR